MPVALSDSAAVTGLIVASAFVLTAFISVGGTVLVTRFNASTTQQQKEMDKDQRLEEYRRELVEKRRDERRDAYLRWMKAAQDVQTMIADVSSSPSPDRTKALATMKPLYDVYNELVLLDSPDDLVKLAAYTQRHQRAFINGRTKLRGGALLIELGNRMQADLTRDDDIIAPHRRLPQTRFNLSTFKPEIWIDKS